MTIKQRQFVDAFLDKDKDTYRNGTRSALKTYDTDNYNVAANIASGNLKNANVANYLEQRASELGIGLQVRLSHYGEIAAARTPRRSTSRQYKRDDNGRLILMAKVVTDSPVKDADRIKALRSIDIITGLKEQREIDKVQAMEDYNKLYDRVIGKNKGKLIATPEPTEYAGGYDEMYDDELDTDAGDDAEQRPTIEDSDDGKVHTPPSADTGESIVGDVGAVHTDGEVDVHGVSNSRQIDNGLGDAEKDTVGQKVRTSSQGPPAETPAPGGKGTHPPIYSSPPSVLGAKKHLGGSGIKKSKKIIGYKSGDVIKSLLKGV